MSKTYLIRSDTNIVTMLPEKCQIRHESLGADRVRKLFETEHIVSTLTQKDWAINDVLKRRFGIVTRYQSEIDNLVLSSGDRLLIVSDDMKQPEEENSVSYADSFYSKIQFLSQVIFEDPA